MGVETSVTDELLSQPVSLEELRLSLSQGDLLALFFAMARENMDAFLKTTLRDVIWGKVAPAIGMIQQEVRGYLQLKDAAQLVGDVFRHTDERIQRWARVAAPEIVGNLCNQAVDSLVTHHHDRAVQVALTYSDIAPINDMELRFAIAEHAAGPLFERVCTIMGYNMDDLGA